MGVTKSQGITEHPHWDGYFRGMDGVILEGGEGQFTKNEDNINQSTKKGTGHLTAKKQSPIGNKQSTQRKVFNKQRERHGETRSIWESSFKPKPRASKQCKSFHRRKPGGV